MIYKSKLIEDFCHILDLYEQLDGAYFCGKAMFTSLNESHAIQEKACSAGEKKGQQASFLLQVSFRNNLRTIHNENNYCQAPQFHYCNQFTKFLSHP